MVEIAYDVHVAISVFMIQAVSYLFLILFFFFHFQGSVLTPELSIF